MQNKILYILLFLLPFMAIAQKVEPRKLLRGRVTADSLQVDNITVLNTTSNISAITDEKGNFNIYARPLDTLLFSSITYYSAKMVLRKEQFTDDRLVVQLDLNVTTLDELVITPLTGNLESDVKKVKTKEINNQFKADTVNNNYAGQYKYDANPNTLMDPVNRDMHGLNLVNVYKLLVKKKKDNTNAANGSTVKENFVTVVQDRFSYHFFTQTLKIPKKEIGLFLAYCDTGAQAQKLLALDKEFELTDYLVEKSVAYLKRK